MKFLVFPGQGSQYPGMGKDWFEQIAEARQAFEEASDGSGLNLKKLCFEGSEADLKQTEVTQPAILTTSIAIFRSLKNFTDLGPLVSSSVLAGHSLGEYTALVAAGALSLHDAARTVNQRGRFMQEAVPSGQGGMAALLFKDGATSGAQAEGLCAAASKASGKLVAPANYNSPDQIVVAGHMIALDKLEELSKDPAWGARKVIRLAVSAPFHSELMQPAALKLKEELNRVTWLTPVSGTRYIANIDAKLHAWPEAAGGVADRLVKQVTGSVRWTQSTELAAATGATEVLEVGPGAVLSGLAKRTKIAGQALPARNIDKWEDFKNAEFKF